MAIDVPTFVATYPEFADAPPTLIAAKLAEAVTMVPDASWGGAGASNSLTQQGTFLYCAQFLALSPYARHMNLADTNGKTPYDDRISMLRRIVSSGYRSL